MQMEDFARGQKRETVDHYGMHGPLAQQVEQCGHVAIGSRPGEDQARRASTKILRFPTDILRGE
jgi:hypothetical protein